jgi:hypothetical protein
MQSRQASLSQSQTMKKKGTVAENKSPNKSPSNSPNPSATMRPKQPQGNRQNDRKPPHQQAARSSAKIMGDPLIIMDIFDPIRVSKLTWTTKVEKFASTAITILKPNMISSN